MAAGRCRHATGRRVSWSRRSSPGRSMYWPRTEIQLGCSNDDEDLRVRCEATSIRISPRGSSWRTLTHPVRARAIATGSAVRSRANGPWCIPPAPATTHQGPTPHSRPPTACRTCVAVLPWCPVTFCDRTQRSR